MHLMQLNIFATSCDSVIVVDGRPTYLERQQIGEPERDRVRMAMRNSGGD